MMQWIILSSVLIAVVIVLRFALRGKISLRMQYALWLLVLVRLLVPVSFGTSDLSVMNAVPERLPSVQQSMTIPTENATTPAAPLIPAQGIDAPLPSDFVQNTTITDTAPTVRETDWAGIARIVWLAGIAALGFTFLASNLRFGRKLRRSRRSIENTGASLPVYESAETETPCLFGLIKPSIYVTPDTCSDADTLRYALAHEQTHYRHGDHLWAVLRGVCLALHWYNPLVWWAAELSRRDAELACDEATIHALGETERAAYGRTLIRMTCEQRPALLVTATMMTDSGKGLRERITLLVKKPKTAVYTAIAVLLIAGISVICTFTGGSDSEKPYIFEDAPVESITLRNSLTGESSTFFDKTDAPEIEEIMSMLTMLRQGRSIPQPPPGSTELSICVNYQDGRTVNCGNDSFSSGGKTYQVLITPEAASSSLSVWSWESLWESYCPKTVWQSDFLRWCGRFRGENATNLSISVGGAAALGYTGETLKSMASELEQRLRALTGGHRVQLPDADAFDSAICLVIGDNKDEYMINLSADGNYANTLHVLGALHADEEGKYFRPEAYYDAPWIASWIRAKAIPLLEGDLPEAVLPIEEETHEEDGVSQTVMSIRGEFPGSTRLTVGTFELPTGAVTFSGAWSPSYASVCAIVKPSKGDGAVVYFKPGESVSLDFGQSGSCDIVLLAPKEGIDGTMQIAVPRNSTTPPESGEFSDIDDLLRRAGYPSITGFTANGEELVVNSEMITALQDAAQTLKTTSNPPAPTGDYVSAVLTFEGGQSVAMSVGNRAGQVRFTRGDECKIAESRELSALLYALSEARNAELHDLDKDSCCEALCWTSKNNQRNLVIYGVRDGKTERLDVNETLGCAASDYTGNIANIPQGYGNLILANNEIGKGGNLYRYHLGTLQYVTTMDEAVFGAQ